MGGCSLQKVLTRTITALVGSTITFFLLRNEFTCGHFLSIACGITAYEYFHVIAPGLQIPTDFDGQKIVHKNEKYGQESSKYPTTDPVLTRRERGPSKNFLVFICFALTYTAHSGASNFYLTGLVLAVSAVAMCHFVFRWNRSKAPPTTLDIYDLFIDLNGVLIIWALGHMIMLRQYPEYGTAYIAIVLIVAWTADTGALVFGALLGGYTPKLMPVISPNKTWAGFIGALIAGIGIMVFLGLLMQRDYFFAIDPSFRRPVPSTWVLLVIVGLFLGICSVLGDAMESVIKRAAGVKDSGSKLPGHGGFFDRLDSVAACSIVMYCLIIPYLLPLWDLYGAAIVQGAIDIWFVEHKEL